MQKVVSGETPFQIMAHSCAISPSEQGYTLQYSANGVDYTSWDEATPANENLIVNGLAYGTFLRLSGNTSEVVINY